ncbi:MAG TPA: Do family serine endopeptidase [Balneolales bacterium]|nr:Do family serine endopeptidase [Balneolales bacterium]
MSKLNQHTAKAILLLFIGALIGIILVLTEQNYELRNKVKVRFATINQSPGDTTQLVNQVEQKMETGSNIFQNVANKVVPTVVYIEASIPAKKLDMPNDGKHHFNDDIWDRFLPQREIETVGSGVIISSNGYILTNHHVVANAVDNEVQVTLYNKSTYTGKIVGEDDATDLAVVKINQSHLPAITVGNSDNLKIGDWVLAIGNPFRLKSTVTAGIVSALSRDVNVIDNSKRIENFIQTDAAINKGNSGGALVNDKGDLVGINTAIATETGNYEGYGFAIPSNMAIKVARDIIEYGKVKRAYLGVRIKSVNSKSAHKLGLKHIEGVEIVNIDPNGSADKAGIKPKDVVLSVNGERVNQYNELQAKIAVMHPGDVAKLKIWRKGKTFNVNVHLMGVNDQSFKKWLLTDKKEPINISPKDKSVFKSHSFNLGFTVVALADSENFNKFDLVITHVKKGSEASNQGLKKNDVIQAVDGTPVEKLEKLKELISSGLSKNHSVLLKVKKDNGVTGYYELQD